MENHNRSTALQLPDVTYFPNVTPFSKMIIRQTHIHIIISVVFVLRAGFGFGLLQFLNFAYFLLSLTIVTDRFCLSRKILTTGFPPVKFNLRCRAHLELAETKATLLILQCDSGNVHGPLIAGARYCVVDEYQKVRELIQFQFHVVLIIQLPRITGGTFSGFQVS